MLVLGIESTCDETACAVVENGKNILSNVVSSQIDLHREYGGVVPELACRRHIDLMIPILDQALKDARCKIEDIDLISVAHGPGLIGPLLIGLTAAKAVAVSTGKPFIGVSHIEAHLYASMMETTEVVFPALGVVISGGHTSLVLIQSMGTYVPIGCTVDDAIGEAFDKVAKMLDLPYPGGPEIEQLALKGDPHAFPFKPGHVKLKPLDFSFSGLKTAVLYTLRGQNSKGLGENSLLTPKKKQDIAASFQQAALTDVVKKTAAAAKQHGCRHILFGGGVSNNQRLRQMFADYEDLFTLHWPPKGLSLDNAAMIAGLGYHQYQQKQAGDPLTLEALTRIPF